MHLSLLMPRARRVCAVVLVALVAGIVTSCHEGPTDPSGHVQKLQAADSALQVKAGAQSVIRVLVLDGDGRPVRGVTVNWTAQTGTLASTSTASDAQGVAATKWTAEGELGDIAIMASAGSVAPLKLAVKVVPGDPATLDILVDSVRYTAQWQKRLVRVLGFDKYGHPVTPGTDLVQLNPGWAAVWEATPSGDTTVVALGSGFGRHRWYFVLGTSDGRARDSVLVILDPVIVRTEISGLDSTNGLAVGEHAQLTATGIDSSGYTVALDAGDARAQLQLSTSDANIATVASDGTLTAVAPGSVTIDASAPDIIYRARITVYPIFSAGTQKAGISLEDPQGYVQFPVDQYLTDAGVLYELTSVSSHTATYSVLRAHGGDGKVAWTREYQELSTRVAVDPASGVVFMQDDAHRIHAIDPAGTDRWLFDYGSFSTGSCRLAGWRNGVAATCGTSAFALNGDGSLAWSATVSDTAWQIISTPMLAVLRTQTAVTALRDDGSVAWTRLSAATGMIADAASTVYLMERGVHAIDLNGTERWYNATPLAACILAGTERLVVCRDNGIITALDPADGQVRWTTKFPALFGSMAAISGDRILLAGAFLFALDARTGAAIGRSFDRLDEYYISVGQQVMAVTSVNFARVFSTSFTPGSEWAQNGGNAGHGNRVSP